MATSGALRQSIIVWLEVRILPAPPRSPSLTEYSGSSENSRYFPRNYECAMKSSQSLRHGREAPSAERELVGSRTRRSFVEETILQSMGTDANNCRGTDRFASLIAFVRAITDCIAGGSVWNSSPPDSSPETDDLFSGAVTMVIKVPILALGRLRGRLGQWLCRRASCDQVQLITVWLEV